MSPQYLSPGVYVEEVDRGAKPIEGVGTAVAGFVGLAEKGPFNTPSLIANWSRFREIFGDFVEGAYLAHAVYGYFHNGGGSCYVVRVGKKLGNPGPAEEPAAAEKKEDKKEEKKEEKAPPTKRGKNSISAREFIGDPSKRTGLGGLEAVDEITMIAIPDIMATYQSGDLEAKDVQAIQSAMLAHSENMKDRFAILDPVPDLNPQQVNTWRMQETGYDSKYGALYYPWIQVTNPLNGAGLLVPPSGHLAGIYARSDTERGVHKAPANEVVRGAIGLALQITKSEQDSLNPIGVNCIRAFPGRGIRVWGARTISSDPAWRYINVRRLFNYIEESIELGTQWVVFEPNDVDLWERVKRDITAFLTRVWRDGALFGTTPEEAFYVKCDEELNPPEVRDAGMLIIEIGLAPVKPAEFVIFRISQWAGGTAVSE
jgi:phage tail sheath protein FI